jgi:hypothetical protein
LTPVRCLRCRHKALLLPVSLAMRVGTNYPLERLYRRLVYKRCGGRRGLSRYQTGRKVMVSNLCLLRSAKVVLDASNNLTPMI